MSKLWILVFFPIYFGIDGVYKTNDLLKSGLIVPLSFVIGAGISVYLLYKIARREEAIPEILRRIPVFFCVALLIAIVGVALSTSLMPMVMFAQMLSGAIGVALAIWMFSIKKFDFMKVTAGISVLYMVLIALDVLRAVTTTGFGHFMDRFRELPGTYWWTIYHAFVYYPYLVSTIFLFAAPYWRNKLHPSLFYALYGSLFFYLWVFQVRGAILSYVIGMAIYLIFFTKWRNVPYLLGAAALIYLSFVNLPTDVQMGRFIVATVIEPDQSAPAESPTDTSSGTKTPDPQATQNTDDEPVVGVPAEPNLESSLKSLAASAGGRADIYKNFLNNFNDPLYTWFGTFFKGRPVSTDSGEIPDEIGLGSLGGSYHNQYFEFVDAGGILLLIGFIWCLYPIAKRLLIYSFKAKSSMQKTVLFWTLLAVIHFGIDLNINVPIRVTNPAILYWFYWSGLGLYVTYLITNKAIKDGDLSDINGEARAEH